MRIAAFILSAALIGVLAGCGSSSPSQPITPTPTPTIAPTPTPTPSGIVLPPGMVCSPTPPPLYGMKVKVHDDSGTRKVLDSKPLVMNVGGYCARVGAGGETQKFCDTRLEGDPQRTACDYLVTGVAPATGRWGPTWTWNGRPCDGENFSSCATHQDNQFMAIAKTTGDFEACASSEVTIAAEGQRCGKVTVN